MVALDRDEKGRLTSRYAHNADDLLALVGAAARRLPVRERETMSQAQFDRYRSERQLNCPTAKRIAEIARFPWREVVALAQQ